MPTKFRVEIPRADGRKEVFEVPVEEISQLIIPKPKTRFDYKKWIEEHLLPTLDEIKEQT